MQDLVSPDLSELTDLRMDSDSLNFSKNSESSNLRTNNVSYRSSHANYFASVVVIGAGQAGLSAAYHLQKRGFVDAQKNPSAPFTYIVLDADSAPGGAWRYRWDSLTMATVNNIFDLPQFPKPPTHPEDRSNEAIPNYFAYFERHYQLAIKRPVRVLRVSYVNELESGLSSDKFESVLVVDESHTTSARNRNFFLETTAGTWEARAIINATGTWDNPILPYYPGKELFTGQQLHTRDYRRLEDFTGKRVAIVGGGISAVQLLEEVSRVTQTFWYTRREPEFHEQPFTKEYGHEVVEKVIADVESGRPTGSVVSYTGLSWSPYALAAKERGVLERREMFQEITAKGVIEADGKTKTELDVILWATGFKPAVSHLEPLNLRNEQGAIQLSSTHSVLEPRLHLIGYGPSQSTVGANRAGRIAASTIHRQMKIV